MENTMNSDSTHSAPRSKTPYEHLWLPFTYFKDVEENPPLIIDKGEGIYLFDSSGCAYIDGIGSWWVSIFGHNHPVITSAVKKQLDKLEHVMMAGIISEPALRLSNLLSEILPKGLSRIFYSDNGSTAVEIALKIALQYHSLRGENRTEFVSFDGGYHGDTLGAMSVGMIPQYHALFHECFKKHTFANSPYCYRCPVGLDAKTSKAEFMDSLEKILSEKGESIAACIFEPMVQGAVGMRVYPSKVLSRIFSLCRKYGILTIADEVAMGFGRTGTMFACDHSSEVPDIMCVAKGLTGGYLPLSATVVKEQIFEEFKGDYKSERILNHGHTFTGNPRAASAACATLTLVKEYDIPGSLQSKADFFAKELQKFSEYDIVGDIRTIGMVGALELVRDKKTKERLPADLRLSFKISRKALKYGLIIRPLGDVLYFMPPLIITEEQIRTMLFLTHRALREVIDEELSYI